MFGRKSFRFRPFTWFLAAILATLVAFFAIGCFIYSAPKYNGPASDHFNGRVFFNKNSTEREHFGSFLKWIWTRKPGLWLPYRELPAGLKPPERVTGKDLRVTFVNHSTVLIQMDGLNILTDPVWSARVGPVSWAGPRRHIPPGINFEDLPPIDIVLLSHNHYDHTDIPTLTRLAQKFDPRIFSGLGSKRLLNDNGLKSAYEMDWWDSFEIKNGVRLFFVPSVHFSSRSFCDRNRTLWGGFVIQGLAGTVYFAGDTGMGPHFEEIKAKFGPPRLAILPIGASEPRWFMAPVHISPEEAFQVHQFLQAGTSIPTQFDTFSLGDDGQFEASERLARAIIESGETHFWIPKAGDGRDVP